MPNCTNIYIYIYIYIYRERERERERERDFETRDHYKPFMTPFCEVHGEKLRVVINRKEGGKRWVGNLMKRRNEGKQA